MGSNWPSMKISDVAVFLNNKRVPLKGLDREKRQGKYPYYGASGIVDYIDGYIFDGNHLLISEDGENLRSRNTPIAFKAHGKFWVNNHAHILQEKEPGILDYLEYFFSKLDLNPYITGAAQPKLNKANLERIEIPVPPLEERLKLNQILNSLTEKISINEKTNQTLEEMAQAIFKSWFVDFDPVKAKAQVIAQGGSEQDANLAAMQIISGKTRDQLAALEHTHPEQYTQLHTTASLFPSAFVESELGEIPEGWGGTNVSSILTLNYGRALKSTDRITGDVPVYGSGGVNGYHNEPLVTEESIVVGRKGSIGNLFWVDKPFFPIDTTFYVSTKNVPLSFCYYTLMELNLSNMNTDAAVPGLNRENVYRCEFCLPSSEILLGFDTIQSSLKQLILSNRREISHLENIRDSLLPKLLSGELEI